jgi:hypothetical protein
MLTARRFPPSLPHVVLLSVGRSVPYSHAVSVVLGPDVARLLGAVIIRRLAETMKA